MFPLRVDRFRNSLGPELGRLSSRQAGKTLAMRLFPGGSALHLLEMSHRPQKIDDWKKQLPGADGPAAVGRELLLVLVAKLLFQNNDLATWGTRRA